MFSFQSDFPYFNPYRLSENLNNTDSVGVHFFQQVAENFIGRASKLESELQRYAS